MSAVLQVITVTLVINLGSGATYFKNVNGQFIETKTGKHRIFPEGSFKTLKIKFQGRDFRIRSRSCKVTGTTVVTPHPSRDFTIDKLTILNPGDTEAKIVCPDGLRLEKLEMILSKNSSLSLPIECSLFGSLASFATTSYLANFAAIRASRAAF